MKKTILLFACIAIFAINDQAQTVTDYDGNIYYTVTIGAQVWMRSNLKVTHYRNGDAIPNVTDETQWGNLTTGAYCNYDNSTDTAITYGRLYNYFTVVDNRNLCPTGWHIPTNAEILTLKIAAGGSMSAGGNMKETGTVHWLSPNTGATNSTGFTALPAGFRCSGFFQSIRHNASFWTSTSVSSDAAYEYSIDYDDAWLFNTSSSNNKKCGYSIRCLQGAGGTSEINIMEKINIHPNPAIDRITVYVADMQNMNLSVYNIVGELMLQRELNNMTNEIDISALTTGIYIIKVTGADWTMQQKLIKE
jgi:uncharacterized protein (TIGR02145 family)